MPSLDDVLGRRPDLAARWHALEEAVWASDAVPAATLEAVRLRLATLLDAAAERAHRRPGVEPATRDDPATAACVDYAETMVVDPHGVTDEMAAAVTDHFGGEGLTVLTTAVAVWDGIMRAERMLGVTER